MRRRVPILLLLIGAPLLVVALLIYRGENSSAASLGRLGAREADHTYSGRVALGGALVVVVGGIWQVRVRSVSA